MNSNTMIPLALGIVLAGAGSPSLAAVLDTGDMLSIGAGSWFAVDADGNGAVTGPETVAINPGSDGGIVIGSTQAVGAIDAWTWYDIPGNHYTTAAPGGGTTTGLDLSGWSIFWNGAPVDVVIDYGAWTPTNCDTLGCAGVSFAADTATFSWSGVYGESYSLWYAWSFQNVDPGCFCSTDYLLHLEGVVTAGAATPVPLPPALWLLGSGVMLILRKRSQHVSGGS